MIDTQDINVTFGKSTSVPFGDLSLSQLRIFAYEYAKRLKSENKSTPAKVKKGLPKKDTLDTASPKDVDKHDPIQKPNLTISGREKLINLHNQARKRRSSAMRAEELELQGGRGRLKNIFSTPLEIDSDYVAPEYPKSVGDMFFLDSCMSNNFIFSGLSVKEKDILIKAMEPAKAAKGDLIIKQGDMGDYFYAIRDGLVSFIEDGKVVNSGCKGDSFGELALLHDSPRTASARAEIDCTLFRVDQKTFRSILANNRGKVSQDCLEILRKVQFLSHLDEKVLAKIAEALTTITFFAGDIVVRKGDKGDVFYIIKKGKVLVSDIGHGESAREDRTLGCGDCFGERALLTGDARGANVTAVGDCELFCVSRDQFERDLGKFDVLIRAAQAKQMLYSVPMIAAANLEPFEMDQLVRNVEAVTYLSGDVLSRAGDVIGSNPKYPQGFYFVTHDILGGEISAVDSSGRAKILKVGDYFGARTITAEKGEKSDLDIMANKTTSCTMISLSTIKRVLKNVERLGQARSYRKELDTNITMDTLEKHTILGEGTFGQVWLVSDKRTSHTYALKIQSKRELITHGQAQSAVREKNIMARIDSQFVIKLFNAFQDSKNLFMVTSLVQGGELYSLLHEGGANGISERDAKFYTACISQGLNHMHRHHIVYRDMKPENIMIDKDGYAVLIDLGFAKVVLDKTFTLCGTPLYLAPEIILSGGYDQSVDFWSLGALIYEMLIGYSPFYSKGVNQAALFKRILRVSYSFPGWCGASDTVQELISKMLVRLPKNRLGSLAGGVADIHDHLWLRNIGVADLHAKKFKAPWVPNIKGPLDVSLFDDWDHLEDKQHIKGAKLTIKEQELFESF